jgi:hypothetical protein
LVVVVGVVVRVVVEVWKAQVAVLEPFHAETDRQPTGGEVHAKYRSPPHSTRQSSRGSLSPAVALPFRRGGGR